MLPLLLALSGPARPCAALVVEEGGSASTSAQEAIVEKGPGYVETTWRVQVDHDVHQLGWIIPLYGAFQSLEEADPTRFDELRAATAPIVWVESVGGDEDEGGGLGCGGDKSLGMSDGRGNEADSGSLGVTVVAEGFSGAFGYTVLEATSDVALLTWLDEHGFGIGPSAPAIASYVAEGGIQFLALDVSMDAADGQTRELPAVRIRTKGDSLRYPSLMAQYGMPTQVSTRVFVLGDQRATVGGGWQSEPFGTREAGSDVEGADEAFREQLEVIGGDAPVFAEIWSGSWEGAWLTRLDTVAYKEVHQSDAVFTLDGGQEARSSELILWGTSGAGLLLPGGLLGLLAIRRRAQRPLTPQS